MAKYTRFDPRNKKATNHKNRMKFGTKLKRIHHVHSDEYQREKL